MINKIQFSIEKTFFGSNNTFQLNMEGEILTGQLIALYGPSGSGKTTLLRLLAGLEKPDQGSIYYNQQTWFLAEKKYHRPIQQRPIGFLFQDYALFPNMTVYENIAYPLSKPNQKKKSMIEELLNLVGLIEFAAKKPMQLSGGQKQRVALARALARQPEILFLDEPLAALDKSMRRKLQEDLLHIAAIQKITIIFATHDVGEIFRLASHVWHIENGKIIKKGTPHDLFLKEKISGKFRFNGEILAIEKTDTIDALHIITALIGNNIVKVTATAEEIKMLAIGDQVMMIAKAFHPFILRQKD